MQNLMLNYGRGMKKTKDGYYTEYNSETKVYTLVSEDQKRSASVHQEAGVFYLFHGEGLCDPKNRVYPRWISSILEDQMVFNWVIFGHPLNQVMSVH